MKTPKQTIFLFLFLSVFVFLSQQTTAQQTHKIPTQNLALYELIGKTSDKIFEIKEFEISDFITFKEYKMYLSDIKRDSSQEYYLSQLPDTNISTDKKAYQEYITNNIYDDYPVLGISWDNAMNYCKWKTQKEENVIYRLPLCSEWLAASHYYEQNNIEHDMNNKYSDWTLNQTTYWVRSSNFSPDTCLPFYYDRRIYISKKSDPKVYKRQTIVGKSYLYQLANVFGHAYYYAFEGYRHIGFRIVKEEINQDEPTEIQKIILKHWGIYE
jgi:Sulfatase-modifying factor enzyme 1